MKKIVSVAILLSFAVAAMAQEAPKKYDVKSGIAKVNTSVMGQTVESTIYFDDYGAVEATKTKTALQPGSEIEVTTLSKDGKTYIVIPSMKQIQEQPTPESINYLALTDDVIAKYKIEKAGTETVCGKECTIYKREVSQLGQTEIDTDYVWKGFPMKTVAKGSGLELVREVTEFTEDAFILPQTFEIPSFE